jgi:ATP-dependent Clp protease ATP-binding subunit ClpA
VTSLLSPDRFAKLISWEISPNVARQFEVEAKRDRAEFIESEHMLLALASDPESEAGRLLHEAGLDHERLASALQEERRRTLAFAGMNAPSKELIEATELNTVLTYGTSAKTAFRRALIGSRERHRRPRLRGLDLLAGILQAELGTVPRALAIAGVDRVALMSRVIGAEVKSHTC